MSDFNYGILPTKLVSKLSEVANKNNIVITADSQSSSQFGDISRFKRMNLITPTEYEARLALNDKESGIVSLAYNLIKKSEAKNAFITLGEDGVLIQDGQNIENGKVDRLYCICESVEITLGRDSMFTAASLALGLVQMLLQHSLALLPLVYRYHRWGTIQYHLRVLKLCIRNHDSNRFWITKRSTDTIPKCLVKIEKPC